ncbi:MAG: S-layer homology domain-containing protein [Oscillibacter sp.]|nr:S-layer homology domain-containing protein [Oscillibacter sp.]
MKRFSESGHDAPDFVKITNAGTASIDLSDNFWSGCADAASVGDGAYAAWQGQNDTTSACTAVTLSGVRNTCDAFDADTLIQALGGADGGQTVRLTANVTADAAVPEGRTVTLDLNGYTLTGAATADTTHTFSTEVKAALANYGTLTVKDSSNAKTGAIKDNSLYYKKAALFNAPTGTLYLNGGTVTNGAASVYYVFRNQGKATVDGAALRADGSHSATILNGWSRSAWDDVPAAVSQPAELTINSGAVTGGRYAVKNGESWARLTINGGTFSGCASDGAVIADYNSAYAQLSGGTYTAPEGYTVLAAKYRSNFTEGTTDNSAMTVSGGLYTGTLNKENNGTFHACGGYFTADPADYVPLNYNVAAGSWSFDNHSYAYKVAAAPDNKIVSASAKVYHSSETDAANLSDALIGAQTTNAAVTLNGVRLTASGKVPADANWISFLCVCSDGTLLTVTRKLTPDSASGTFALDDAVIDDLPSTRYTADVSGLTALPASVTVAATASKATDNADAISGSTTMDAAAKNVAAAANTALTASGAAGAVDRAAVIAGSALTTMANPGGESVPAVIVNNEATPVATVISNHSDALGTALSQSGLAAVDTGNPAVVSVQPVVTFAVAGAVADNTVKSVTVDVTVARQVFVTSQAVAASGEPLTESSAVAVGDPQSITLDTPLEISVPLGAGFAARGTYVFATHTHGTNPTEILRTDFNYDTQVADVTITGTSAVTFSTDQRALTVDCSDGQTRQYYYLSDQTAPLPTAAALSSGQYFIGWRFAGISGTYTALSSTLWDKLLGTDTSKTVSASAVYGTTTSSSSGGGSGSSKYSVTVKDAQGGSVASDVTSAAKGDTVTLTVAPKAGFQLKSLTAAGGSELTLNKKSDTVYTFTMPASPVTVTPVFTDKAMDFTDVPAGYWARDSIAWAYGKGYMQGSTDSAFNPGGAVTRQQLWMVLARISGADPADMAAARTWAMENGISDGSNPTLAVSRQQMVTILYRCAMKFCALAAEDSGSMGLAGFADSGSIADYAHDAVHWAVRTGILKGSGDKLYPSLTATRAQFSVLLQRFCAAYLK